MINQAYQKLVLQLNILEKDYFLKDLLNQVDLVKKQAIEAMIIIEEIEALMKVWQSEVILEAQKEAEMLYTDEQLAAIATLRNQINGAEERIKILQKKLEELDEERRSIESKLIMEREENRGSRLLAGAAEGFWEILIEQRKNNIENRHQDLLSFVDDLKTRISATLTEEKEGEGEAKASQQQVLTV